MKTDYLAKVRDGEELSLKEKILLVIKLAIPAIIANAASTVMTWIDTSMVGSLGANASASVGLVSSCTWLIGGLCMSCALGFTVIVAQRIGAKDEAGARNILKQGFIISVSYSLLICLLCAILSSRIPVWLGGADEIVADSKMYMLIYAFGLPWVQAGAMCEGMLRASGNMRTPSIIYSSMCVLDVIFNSFLIYPEHKVLGMTLPGAGLGVTGAALGTFLAEVVVCFVFMYALFIKSPALHLRKGEKVRFEPEQIKRCLRISIPNAFQRVLVSGAQVASTAIIAPLGTQSIAANSIATTAEAICYMPGYGIESAASTMIGQSIGAGRKDMAKSLGWVNIISSMAIMGVMAVIGSVFAEPILGFLTVDATVVALGASVFRIEMLAEPLFGASIVCAGVFQGAGDAMAITVMNIASIWGVRVSLMLLLVEKYGLRGAWIAMTVELAFRGTIFLIRMVSGRWLKNVPD